MQGLDSPGLPGLGEGMALILRVSGKYHASINPPLKFWFSACTAPCGSFWNFVETPGVAGIRIILGIHFIHFRVVMRALHLLNILKRCFV